MKKGFFIFWITIGLAVFGIVGGGFKLGHILPPLIVFGAVFLLYKFPPKKYRKSTASKIKPSARTMAKVNSERRQSTPEKRKHYPFQVIEGQKGKNDDTPKYH